MAGELLGGVKVADIGDGEVKSRGYARRRRSMTLACLLPVRNGASHLPGWLESAATVADTVVALDDGSTDATHQILEASPLVARLVCNPARANGRGWDDRANRQRLLEAADAVTPNWVLFLDADERIDPEDAAALRGFISSDADPEHGYGFRVFTMSADGRHYQYGDGWVYRLFAWEPGQRLLDGYLDRAQLPREIPPERWLRTTVRIKHFGAASRAGGDRPASRRRPRRWELRPAALGVLERHQDVDEEFIAEIDSLDLDGPVISAIVVGGDDTRSVEPTLKALAEQECPVVFEVIVVVASARGALAATVREAFPAVTLVELGGPVPPGHARNAGLRLARGDYVVFVSSDIELAPGSLAARVDAHDEGHAMVAGPVVDRAGRTPYLLEREQISYRCQLLREIGGFPEHLPTGEETIVRARLAERGHRIHRLAQTMATVQAPHRRPGSLIRERFLRGRALGRALLDRNRLHGRLLSRRLLRSAAAPRPEPLRARPPAAAGAVASWAGVWFELLRPGRQTRRLRRAGVTVLIAGLDGWPGDDWPGRTDLLMLARLDFVEHRAKVLNVPRDLLVEIPGVGSELVNAAYNLGRWRGGDDAHGAAMLRQALESAFDLAIDEHVLVDFRGFIQVVDALGGVEIDVPSEIHDETPGGFTAHFDAGPQWMSGHRALDYVRSRKGGPDAPVRTLRQLDVLRALAAAARRNRSPLRLVRLRRALDASLRTSLGIGGKLTVAWQLSRIRDSAITVEALGEPTLSVTRSPRGAWAYGASPRVLASFAAHALGPGTPAHERPLDRGPTTLSPHFNLEQFHCRDGTPVPVTAYHSLSRLCHEYLEPMRARFGPATVWSGYRTEAYNERVGGTHFSRHIYELHPTSAAADVGFERGSPAEWAAFADELGAGGVGRYDRLRFVHVDTRDEPARWQDEALA